jgi:hypothetical protein
MASYSLKNLGAIIVRKGEGDVALSNIMRNGELLKDAIALNAKSDMVILGVRQNDANYFVVGSINHANSIGESLTFRNGADNGYIKDVNNEDLPYITHASHLLLDNYRKLDKTLYCDKDIANDVMEASVDEVNGYLNFCRKHGVLEDNNIVQANDEEIVTLQTIEHDSQTPSLFKDQEASPLEVFAYLDEHIQDTTQTQQIDNGADKQQPQKENQNDKYVAPRDTPSM